MKTWLICAIGLLLAANGYAADKEDELRYKMSLNDEFVVSPPKDWMAIEDEYLQLRFANVHVTPKEGSAFSLRLMFRCDTPDLAKYDSIEKIEKSVTRVMQKYLPSAVEKRLTVKKIREGQKVGYGCYAVLTDADVAKRGEVGEGEFKYVVCGMIRLSADSALGFQLMTNEVDTPGFRKILDFIQSFVKKG